MKRLNYKKDYTLNDIKNLIKELQIKNIITEKEAKSINPDKVYKFTKSIIWQYIINLLMRKFQNPNSFPNYHKYMKDLKPCLYFQKNDLLIFTHIL